MQWILKMPLLMLLLTREHISLATADLALSILLEEDTQTSQLCESTLEEEYLQPLHEMKYLERRYNRRWPRGKGSENKYIWEKLLYHLSSDTFSDLLLNHTAPLLGFGSVVPSSLVPAASPLCGEVLCSTQKEVVQCTCTWGWKSSDPSFVFSHGRV